MADLYGRLRGYKKNGYRAQRTENTCLGHGRIEADLETWEGKITTELEPNGDFVVLIGAKHGSGKVVMTGNVGDEGRYYIPANRKHKIKVAQAKSSVRLA